MVGQGRPATGAPCPPPEIVGRVGGLLDSGLAVGQTAWQLGTAAATVSSHLRKLRFPGSTKHAPRSNWDDIQA
jgi:hypothetical protein